MTEHITKLRMGAGIMSDTCVNDMAEIVAIDCMRIISEQSTLEENQNYREGFSEGRKRAWLEIRKLYEITDRMLQ